MIQLSLVLLMLAFTIIQGYVFGVAGKYGFQHSISYTDYILKKPFKGVFEAVLTTCGILLSTVAVVLTQGLIWPLFIAGICFVGVAVFARYKLSKAYLIAHTICATGGFMLLAATPLVYFGKWLPTLIVGGVVLTTYLMSKKSVRTWWTELSVIYSSFISLFIIIVLMFV